MEKLLEMVWEAQCNVCDITLMILGVILGVILMILLNILHCGPLNVLLNVY